MAAAAPTAAGDDASAHPHAQAACIPAAPDPDANVSPPEFLTYAEARSRVLGAVRPLEPVLTTLDELAGRALRETIRAPYGLPSFANSAMDGYAVRAAETAAAPVTLPVAGVIPAGRVAAHALRTGTVMRIMTGAPLPDGADAVVPFEDTERLTDGADERVCLRVSASAGAHIRDAGTDIGAGAVALESGRSLSAHDVALLASLGLAGARVSPRPTVAILSTGDELLTPGEPLRPGALFDSNLPMLCLLAREAGCDVVMAEHTSDDPAVVTSAIRRALAAADVVLTIGGVSAGDFDPVKSSLDAIGGIALWRVAMRPGKPQAFGTPDGRVFYGLPGNPASVACVFEALVRPALRRMQGFTTIERPRLMVRAGARVESRAGRVDFVRALLAHRDDAWWATPAGPQTSGHVVPQSAAHALMIVPHEVDHASHGDRMEAILLRWPEHAEAAE